MNEDRGDLYKYLKDEYFDCEYSGDAEDYARYRKYDIEVLLYGSTVRINKYIDAIRECHVCGGDEKYVKKEEVYFNGNATLNELKSALKKYE